jgi:hypothetical protein
VSVVLLNFNGKEYAKLWSSLFNVDYPNYEIIFVDNGSSDESLKFFNQLVKNNSTPYIKRIMIIKLRRNVGYSKANNIGIKESKGKYIALLSNDIEVDKNWLKNIISFFEKNKEAGIAQPLMFYFYDRNKLDYNFGFMNVLGNIFGATEVVSFSRLNKPFEVFFCEGASMIIRRELLDKTGYLFDDDYFMYYEDVDFCWRARKQGYKCFVVPSSIVYHVRSGTVSEKKVDTRIYQSLFVRNRLLTLFRNYHLVNAIKYIPLSILLLLFESIIVAVIKKRTNSAINIVKGIALFILQIPKEVKKRKGCWVVYDDLAKHLLTFRDSLKLMLKRL